MAISKDVDACAKKETFVSRFSQFFPSFALLSSFWKLCLIRRDKAIPN